MTPQLSQLLKELDTLEFDIDKLISMNSSTTLLDMKLSQLASSVAAIPAEQASLKNEWQRRMDILMQKHREATSKEICDFDWTMAPEKEVCVNTVAAPRQAFSEQELSERESVILKLFNIKPFPSDELESKISIFTESVNHIPSEYPELARKWNTKASELMEKLTNFKVSCAGDSNVSLLISDQQQIHNNLINEVREPNSQELGDFDWTMAPKQEEISFNIMEPPMVYCAGNSNLSPLTTQQPIKNLINERENISSLSQKLETIESDMQKHGEPNLQGLSDFDWTMAPKQEEISFNKMEPPMVTCTGNSNLSLTSDQRPINKNLMDETEIISSSLSQKLETIESAIVNMLALNPRPSDALEKKISELVESVGNIPAENDQLTNKWSDKLGFIMDKFFAVDAINGLPSNDESCNDFQPLSNQLTSSLEDLHRCLEMCPTSGDNVEPTSRSTTFEIPNTNIKQNDDYYNSQPAYSSNQGNDNYGSAHVNNNAYSDENTGNGSYASGGYGNDTHTEAHSGTAYNNENIGNGGYKGYGNEGGNRRDQDENDSELRAVKEEMTSKIKSAFDRFNPETYLRGIRSLLPLVAKARRLVDSYRGYRVPFYGEVFTLAHNKLPAVLKSNCDPEMDLNGLVQLLNNKIREAMEAQFAEREVDEIDMCFTCSFCRVPGHTSNSCPRIRAMFCLNCFRFGHQKSRCCNDTVLPEDVTF